MCNGIWSWNSLEIIRWLQSWTIRSQIIDGWWFRDCCCLQASVQLQKFCTGCLPCQLSFELFWIQRFATSCSIACYRKQLRCNFRFWEVSSDEIILQMLEPIVFVACLLMLFLLLSLQIWKKHSHSKHLTNQSILVKNNPSLALYVHRRKPARTC